MQCPTEIEKYFAPEPHIVVLGVRYLHLRLTNGDELYLTADGLRFCCITVARQPLGRLNLA